MVTVACAPFLAFHLSDNNTASGTNIFTGASVNHKANRSSDFIDPKDEPEMAAANPVDANSWTILPDIQRGRFESTAIQYRDDMYVFNGFGLGIEVESTVEKFDAGTQKWSVIGNTSVAKGNAVTHNGFLVHGKEVWILGGRVGNHSGAVTNKLWILL